MSWTWSEGSPSSWALGFPELSHLDPSECSSDHGNDDYGNALPELGKLTSLTSLNLADSNFRGSLWDLRRLSRLASLDLSRNGWLMDLKDNIPVISNLTGLTCAQPGSPFH